MVRVPGTIAEAGHADLAREGLVVLLERTLQRSPLTGVTGGPPQLRAFNTKNTAPVGLWVKSPGLKGANTLGSRCGIRDGGNYLRAAGS